MSEWFEQKIEDISLDDKGEELHIWFESNDFGNRYVSVMVEDVLRVINNFNQS